jgi:tetratricopeptide (TPR) repeat protein
MDERLQRNLALGRGCFEKRQYGEAERYLTQVLEENQSFPDVYNMLGVIFHDRGAFEKAQRAFEAALRLNPAYTDAALNLSVILNELGRYSEAREIYQAALTRNRSEGGTNLDPFVRGKITNLYADLGDAWATAGRLDEAVVEYRRALELSPSFADIRVRLANALRERGEHEAAVAELTRAVETNPTYLPARLSLGLALFAAGRRDEAVAAWEEVLARSPGNRHAEMYLKMVRSGAEGDPGPVIPA